MLRSRLKTEKNRLTRNLDNQKDKQIFKLTQQTFQCCFNIVFWLYKRCDVGQRQINVEATLLISTLEFTPSNKVEQRCHFQRQVSECQNNVAKMTISKTNKKHFKLYTRNSKF